LRPYFAALFAATAQGQMGQPCAVVFRVLDGVLPPGVRLQPGLQALAGGACGVESACLAQTAAFFRTDESAMDFSESAMRFPFSNLTKTVRRVAA
jgi:hypothetical protein